MLDESKHSRRCVFDSKKSLSHKYKRVLRKTNVLKLPKCMTHILCGSLLFLRLCIDESSAGSLAVIFQPAFLPFD